jgi:hypothetical protein
MFGYCSVRTSEPLSRPCVVFHLPDPGPVDVSASDTAKAQRPGRFTPVLQGLSITVAV